MIDGRSFFRRLVAENEQVHLSGLQHPVVQGIGRGTLGDDIFRYYIEQDYQFLIRHVRAIALALAGDADLPTMTRLAQLLHDTLSIEMDALADLYRSFGGESSALPGITPSPTCQVYTDHLLATAAGGDLLVTLAALLPCQWGYREIGRQLAGQGLPDDPRFARWISEYASDEYGLLVDWLLERFDDLATAAGDPSRDRAAAVFALSSRYELAFWEMAVRREQWPVLTGSTAALQHAAV